MVFVPAGEARDALVPFVWNGAAYRVPGSELRHLSRDCPALLETVEARGWVDRVQNNAELRASTAKCTGGCWTAFEQAEQRAAERGDETKGRDREEHAIRGRERLARRVQDGLVRGAVVKREG